MLCDDKKTDFQSDFLLENIKPGWNMVQNKSSGKLLVYLFVLYSKRRVNP